MCEGGWGVGRGGWPTVVIKAVSGRSSGVSEIETPHTVGQLVDLKGGADTLLTKCHDASSNLMVLKQIMLKEKEILKDAIAKKNWQRRRRSISIDTRGHVSQNISLPEAHRLPWRRSLQS